MKLTDKLLPLLPAVLCLGLAGCLSSPMASPVGGGYEELAHPTRASAEQPGATRVSFQYRAPGGKVTRIWPSLYGVNEVIHGPVAIFVGDKAYISPDPDNPRGLTPRLFAVRAPDLPLDITDEVLWRWAKAVGKNFASAQSRFSMIYPESKNGRLELHLVFWTDGDAKDWPGSATFSLDWAGVSDIMRVVQAKGSVRKDLRWQTQYIE